MKESSGLLLGRGAEEKEGVKKEWLPFSRGPPH